jgi:hypothetical protein
MELISHTCNAFYERGYGILKKDATNGFQEIRRDQLHRAIAKRCPSLLSLFQKYYTHESLGFYDLNSEIRTIQVQEGCRMGCKLSSFAFALTVQDPYLDLQEQLNHSLDDKTLSDGSFVKAATDDCLVVIKADPTNRHRFYRRVRAACVMLEVVGERVGLSFDNDKAQLLIPKGWDLPENEALPGLQIRSDTLPEIRLQGIEIVGSPLDRRTFVNSS